MNDLLLNVNKIHTTEMGIYRIKKNIDLNDCDVVDYCKKMITNCKCYIYKHGKNYYCEFNNVRVTINSYSYTIITAHIIKQS